MPAPPEPQLEPAILPDWGRRRRRTTKSPLAGLLGRASLLEQRGTERAGDGGRGEEDDDEQSSSMGGRTKVTGAGEDEGGALLVHPLSAGD